MGWHGSRSFGLKPSRGAGGGDVRLFAGKGQTAYFCVWFSSGWSSHTLCIKLYINMAISWMGCIFTWVYIFLQVAHCERSDLIGSGVETVGED